MGAAPRRDDADAVVGRHRDRFLDRAHADHEAERVLAVERGGDRRHPLRLEAGLGVDQPAPDPVEVTGEAGDAVGIDAAQVGADQAMGDDLGILLRQAMRQQELEGESLGGFGRDVDAFGGFTWCGHCV